MPRLRILLAAAAGFAALAGCGYRQTTNCPTPASQGINTRDLIDPAAQAETEQLVDLPHFQEAAERVRKEMEAQAPPGRAPRHVLCLSGGGSFGAYSAGVLYGWTCKGDRPCFDVVTGISTGALIAPFAFLGPDYDEQMKRFYTTITDRDVLKPQYVRGILGLTESFASNEPLGRLMDTVLTDENVAKIGAEHGKGRRLFVGTTEEEGKRFIVWDVGAIAARGRPGDRELIRTILIASASIPGAFPAAKIDVTVDGKCYTERHVDGGVSQALFFRPPHVPEGQRTPENLRLAGTRVWVVVAGKLYADPEVIQPWALSQAAKSVSTIIYAQTRGDLQRLYTYSLLNGMEYYISAIPAGFPAPLDSGSFKPDVMTALFDEGVRVVNGPKPWRTTPPLANREEGEPAQVRAGTVLTYQQRGPILPIHAPRNRKVPPMYPMSDQGIPAAIPIRD
jgi:predicted patatin/cPLA2 family phospholipase